MTKFTAVLTPNGGGKLTSIWANDLEDAKRIIERQLSKPGRREILKQWKDNGSQVIQM